MTDIQELTDFLKTLTAETDRRFREMNAETNRKFQETDRELKELAVEQRETSRLVKELTRNISGIADSNGLSAEQYFSAALENSPSLNGVSFDYAEANRGRRDKTLNIREQYDVVLYSREAIGIVEIKYRLKSADIEVLATRKVANFRALYPAEASKDIYLAAAGFSVDKQAVEKAVELGVYVMTQAGEGIKILNDEARVY